MRITGLDQSLVNSGLAYYLGNDIYGATNWRTDVGETKKMLGNVKPELRNVARLDWIKKQLVEELARGTELLVLEGRAPAGINDALSLGGLFSMLELTAYERGVPVLVVPPSSRIAYMSCGTMSTRDGTDALKKFAIKSAMTEMNFNRILDDNEADALYLARMGASYLGLIAETEPKRIEVINNLRLTPEDRKRAEQDRKIAEAKRIEASRNKPVKASRGRKTKQLELLPCEVGELKYAGQGPVPGGILR